MQSKVDVQALEMMCLRQKPGCSSWRAGRAGCLLPELCAVEHRLTPLPADAAQARQQTMVLHAAVCVHVPSCLQCRAGSTKDVDPDLHGQVARLRGLRASKIAFALWHFFSEAATQTLLAIVETLLLSAPLVCSVTEGHGHSELPAAGTRPFELLVWAWSVPACRRCSHAYRLSVSLQKASRPLLLLILWLWPWLLLCFLQLLLLCCLWMLSCLQLLLLLPATGHLPKDAHRASGEHGRLVREEAEQHGHQLCLQVHLRRRHHVPPAQAATASARSSKPDRQICSAGKPRQRRMCRASSLQQ